ncbi:MAG: M20/M25/M40 family metallo-hydrolase [Muribaculaceae bacterium]|nr:M20/M25/M40 family metallo-hydrolase [Muribaculaceae bacterium]
MKSLKNDMTMKQRPTTQRVFEIFKELNQIPRPSHHEERVADYLCRFAERLHLEYDRDKENCVVIRKPATPGHEQAEPIVLLNHMDMVCVGMNDPLNTPIEAVVEGGWMKARGTSLGADNGIGLSMALAVLESDDIEHGPLEVITTTNEEDGMSGASQLAPDFISGRKVINLDSEDYDTITTGAAGACLQFHRIPLTRQPAPVDGFSWYRIGFEGGLGGHSGVDINKGRASAVVLMWAVLAAIYNECDPLVSDIRVGEANASIASSGYAIIAVPTGEAAQWVEAQQDSMNQWLRSEYGKNDPKVRCHIEPCEPQPHVITPKAFYSLMSSLEQTPQGVVRMSDTMRDTVETSNNVGRIVMEDDHIFVSTHTRSFIDNDMETLSKQIAAYFAHAGATSEVVM